MGEKEEQEVLPMNELSQHPFKWRHFQSDIILLCVRWYLRSSLRYRDLEEMMAEPSGRSYNDLPLGSALCTRTRKTLPTASQSQQ
jgi:hypothetical protein